jgi:hypothetical protein
MYLQKVISRKTCFLKLVFCWRFEGQRLGSADPDPDADPHQNVMDLEHWLLALSIVCADLISDPS